MLIIKALNKGYFCAERYIMLLLLASWIKVNHRIYLLAIANPETVLMYFSRSTA